jgi:signal transduction histidine kinase
MSTLPLIGRTTVPAACAQHAVCEDRVERPVALRAPSLSEPAAVAQPPPETPRLKDAILAMVAHELRGPLAPLRLAAQLLRRTCTEAPETVRCLDMIERQIAQIAQLAEDLLDASRVDLHTLRVTKIRTNAADVMADVIAAARLAAAKREQTLHVSCAQQVIPIEADPGRLAQALHNLLHNAGKYTPRGGCIDLNVSVDGADLVISVKDNGLGISATLLPHVFELFSQSSRTLGASAGGMGIGLPVVKAVAEAHGGSASANSDGPGCGSVFVLRMPVILTQIIAPHTLPDSRWR